MLLRTQAAMRCRYRQHVLLRTTRKVRKGNSREGNVVPRRLRQPCRGKGRPRCSPPPTYCRFSSPQLETPPASAPSIPHSISAPECKAASPFLFPRSSSSILPAGEPQIRCGTLPGFDWVCVPLGGHHRGRSRAETLLVAAQELLWGPASESRAKSRGEPKRRTSCRSSPCVG
jgi:hypothetical protein